MISTFFSILLVGALVFHSNGLNASTSLNIQLNDASQTPNVQSIAISSLQLNDASQTTNVQSIAISSRMFSNASSVFNLISASYALNSTTILFTASLNRTVTADVTTQFNRSFFIQSTSIYLSSAQPQVSSSSIPPKPVTTPTTANNNKSSRRFDTGSFIGGMIVTGLLVIIFLVVRRYCKGRPNYGQLK
ncbi:porimin isoform X1 [Hydra vulgaris]|uniref:porimin isoform X1 n=1 Tax=Hydra vulgaris TaxID=6087 RepID=UPI001F5F2A73|nr:porimin isoform X1 [Hydra vulgaris]